jgi:carbon-monoxide dehydrogenase medium subunit
MLMMKAGVFEPVKLVSLRSVEPRYSEIKAEADGSIRIGALTPLAALEHSKDIADKLPVIARTMPLLSNVRVRNVATVGGALAHGDPHMDLPPIMIALGATVIVVGPKGERSIPMDELITSYYETQLAKNELISEVVVPPQAGKRSVYLKCTTRAAHDWPALGVAVTVAGGAGGITEANIVVSAATDRAIRLDKASNLLKGRRPDATLLREAGEASAAEVEPMDDSQGSAAYKRELVRVYVKRALREALEIGDTAQ